MHDSSLRAHIEQYCRERDEAAFRALPTPVIGYVRDDAYHLDLRCLQAQDEARFVAQLGELKVANA